MPDIFPQWKRSEIMSRIRSKNTRPEILVRSILHRNGYRFRIHKKALPGNPDIALPKYRTVIFVHGCFWHGHECRRGALPVKDAEFWKNKIEKNRLRDIENERKLNEAGWHTIVVWTCELRNKEKIVECTNRMIETLEHWNVSNTSFIN